MYSSTSKLKRKEQKAREVREEEREVRVEKREEKKENASKRRVGCSADVSCTVCPTCGSISSLNVKISTI